MIKEIRTSTVFLIFLLLLNFTGCKSKKKAMEAQAAAERARMEQEAADRKQKEEAQRKEAEEAAQREAARQKEMMASEPKTRLGNYFNAIATSPSASSANNSINEALALFASPETPVLIVISEEAGQKDYDRPTTIRNYLNYLKDQKKNMNRISNLQFDNTGKITEVELRKN
jgi:hypothetical protein